MSMIGKNIKWLRLTFGLSLRDVSQLTDIKISTLSSYEERNVTPRADTLFSLYNFFKPAFENLTFDSMIETDLSAENLTYQSNYFNNSKTIKGYWGKRENNRRDY